MKALHANQKVQVQQAPLVYVQQTAPWNLDRLDHPDLPLNGQYHYTLDGTGVSVYILDTVWRSCRRCPSLQHGGWVIFIGPEALSVAGHPQGPH